MPYSPTYPAYPSLDPADLGGTRGYINGLGYTVKWTPTFFNQSQKTLTGASIDISLSPYPIHEFELTYEVLQDLPGVDAAFRRLFGFYQSARGSAGRFTFTNPDDSSVLAQPIGTGDGTTTTFTLVRTIGDAAYVLDGAAPFTEPIGAINTRVATTHIYLNGVVQVSGFTVSLVYANNTITFSSPPGIGVAVTADLGYAYYCQFVEDSLQFEKFASGRWQSLSVKIRSCRPGA